MSLSWPDIMINGLPVLCPLVMAILSQRSGTRSWRVAIYPLGIISAVLAILTLTSHTRRTRVPGDTPDSFIAVYANFIYNLSLIGLYAFSNDIYHPHPIPSSVNIKWRAIRSSKLFKILDIFLSSDRKLNYSPHALRQPSYTAKTSWSWSCDLRNTLKWAIIHSLLVDFFTLPIGYLQDGLYNTDGTRNFQRWCTTLADDFGIPVIVIKLGLMGCYAGTVFSGLQGGWEIAKFVGVGSGLWAEEEWIEIMDRPHLSTSMLDLWGKRYHQFMRSQFHTLLNPFDLPEPIYLFTSFIISALHHLLIMSPLTGTFPIHYLQFFIGCGLVCLVEYSIYKMTGRKVEGVTGWIWTFSWIYILGITSLEVEVENGGFEGFRMPVEVFGRSAYLLDHIL